MSHYIFHINDQAMAQGDQYFNDGEYDKAEDCFRSTLSELHNYDGEQLYAGLLVSELRHKIDRCKWFKRDKEQVHTHLGCVLYYIQRLDLEMVSDLLDDNRTYQDMKKEVFIEKLGIAFDTFRERGDTYLNRSEGFCNAPICNYKKNGYSLRGTCSHDFMDLIFETENDLIKDIYECTEFKCKNTCPQKGNRIMINLSHDDDLPF
jgi:hypothetical protein